MVYVYTRRGYTDIPESVIRSRNSRTPQRRRLFERYRSTRSRYLNYINARALRSRRIERARNWLSRGYLNRRYVPHITQQIASYL